MGFVLDASVTASWAFEEGDPDADAAFQHLRNDAAVVPVLWWFELRNLLLMNERRTKRSPVHTESFLRLLQEFPITIDNSPDERALLALARKHRLTIYDAAYLELAHRTRSPLATLDSDLIRSAQSEKVPLITGPKRAPRRPR